jgi:NAD-dependent dihydropyrimidine dehydrogenase PreA subunit
MNEKLITINEKKCQKDGLCAKICPMRIYTQKKDE